MPKKLVADYFYELDHYYLFFLYNVPLEIFFPSCFLNPEYFHEAGVPDKTALTKLLQKSCSLLIQKTACINTIIIMRQLLNFEEDSKNLQEFGRQN